MQKEFTSSELSKKYNLDIPRGYNVEQKINFLKKRGIIIKESKLNSTLSTKKYIIEDDSIFLKEWYPHPNLPYELTKDGLVRNSKSKAIYSQYTDKSGYITFGDKSNSIHRLLMQIFNPIENETEYFVDHINGIRNDNRLENLRWVFKTENTQLGNENQTKIRTEITRLIQKYGYEKLLILLKKM